MKFFQKKSLPCLIAAVLLASVPLILFQSCGKMLGHSVVLWSIPEKSISDGDIVPVLIKSNISQVYVITVPSTGEKIEVPLWQITAPLSKRKAAAAAEKYADYRNMYAAVKLDGLPMRFEPVNTARQVYRLRKDEIVKILYKGEGAPVMSGSVQMKGDWLRVLTEEGTVGWCFSYNLALFNENDGKPTAAVSDNQIDEALETFLAKKWYPENFRTMIRSGKIDLALMDASYGFNPGSVTKQVKMAIPGLSVSFPFEGVEKTGNNQYRLTNTPFAVTTRGSEFCVIQYVDDKGMPKAYNFVALEDNISELITAERTRRQMVYESICSFGPNFSSSYYGLLQFLAENKFIWSGYQLLSPDIIPADAQNAGTVEIKYFLDKSLDIMFDGVLTFKFNNNPREINFLYKIEDKGLRLEDASGAVFRGSTVTARSANPLVLFFAD